MLKHCFLSLLLISCCHQLSLLSYINSKISFLVNAAPAISHIVTPSSIVDDIALGDETNIIEDKKFCQAFEKNKKARIYVVELHVSYKLYQECEFHPGYFPRLKKLFIKREWKISVQDLQAQIKLLRSKHQLEIIHYWFELAQEYEKNPKVKTIELVDQHGINVLQYAILYPLIKDRLSLVKDILSLGVSNLSYQEPSGGYTPLHFCFLPDLSYFPKDKFINTTECVDMLLRAGAKPYILNKENLAPVHFAAGLPYTAPLELMVARNKSIINLQGNSEESIVGNLESIKEYDTSDEFWRDAEMNSGEQDEQKEGNQSKASFEFTPIHLALYNLHHRDWFEAILADTLILFDQSELKADTAFWKKFEQEKVRKEETPFFYLLTEGADLTLKANNLTPYDMVKNNADEDQKYAQALYESMSESNQLQMNKGSKSNLAVGDKKKMLPFQNQICT